MGTSTIFGICACILIASSMVDASIDDDCRMTEYTRCASLINQLESSDTLVNNKSCEVLANAKSCFSGLLSKCQYSCSREKMDPRFENGQGCTLNGKTYDMPVIDNDGDYAHPCRIIKYMEGCLEYSCPKGPHYLANKKTFVPNLDAVQFSQSEIESLKETFEKCTSRQIIRYTEVFNGYLMSTLNRDVCIEMKLSFKFLLDEFTMSPTKSLCLLSDVQGMVVNMVAAGAKQYVDNCDSLPGGADVFQASSLSTSLLVACAILFGRYMSSYY